MSELKKVKASEKIRTGQMVVMFWSEDGEEHLAQLWSKEPHINGFASHDAEPGEDVWIRVGS